MEEFDHWNNTKKKINQGIAPIHNFPREGQVWISILGKNIGFEQNGSGETFSRPVLVVKKFNNQMFWCVPLSTHQKDLDFYYNFTDPFGKDISLILAQMRLLSVKRLIRDIYEIPKTELLEVKKKLKTFL